MVMTSLTTSHNLPNTSRALKQFHDYLLNLFSISTCVFLECARSHGPDSAAVSSRMQRSPVSFKLFTQLSLSYPLHPSNPLLHLHPLCSPWRSSKPDRPEELEPFLIFFLQFSKHHLNSIWVKTSKMTITTLMKPFSLRNKCFSAIYTECLHPEEFPFACSLESSCSTTFLRFLFQTPSQLLFFPLLQLSWGRRASKKDKLYLREQLFSKNKLTG